ncbi:MAG: ABC transporter permease, partial [Microcystis panniformis]
MSQTITPSSLKASLAPNPTRAATVDDGGNVLGEFLQETLAMTKRLF